MTTGPGAEEIKGHPWFRNVDWIGIMSKQVPGAVNPGEDDYMEVMVADDARYHERRRHAQLLQVL